MYNSIKNPVNKKWIPLNNKEGNEVFRNYFQTEANLLGGKPSARSDEAQVESTANAYNIKWAELRREWEKIVDMLNKVFVQSLHTRTSLYTLIKDYDNQLQNQNEDMATIGDKLKALQTELDEKIDSLNMNAEKDLKKTTDYLTKVQNATYLSKANRNRDVTSAIEKNNEAQNFLDKIKELLDTVAKLKDIFSIISELAPVEGSTVSAGIEDIQELETLQSMISTFRGLIYRTERRINQIGGENTVELIKKLNYDNLLDKSGDLYAVDFSNLNDLSFNYFELVNSKSKYLKNDIKCTPDGDYNGTNILQHFENKPEEFENLILENMDPKSLYNKDNSDYWRDTFKKILINWSDPSSVSNRYHKYVSDFKNRTTLLEEELKKKDSKYTYNLKKKLESRFLKTKEEFVDSRREALNIVKEMDMTNVEKKLPYGIGKNELIRLCHEINPKPTPELFGISSTLPIPLGTSLTFYKCQISTSIPTLYYLIILRAHLELKKAESKLIADFLDKYQLGKYKNLFSNMNQILDLCKESRAYSKIDLDTMSINLQLKIYKLPIDVEDIIPLSKAIFRQKNIVNLLKNGNMEKYMNHFEKYTIADILEFNLPTDLVNLGISDISQNGEPSDVDVITAAIQHENSSKPARIYSMEQESMDALIEKNAPVWRGHDGGANHVSHPEFHGHCTTTAGDRRVRDAATTETPSNDYNYSSVPPIGGGSIYNYSFITNPLTNRKVKITSNLGKTILQKYIDM